MRRMYKNGENRQYLPRRDVIMKVRDIMSNTVIRIRPEEPVEVAARVLEHYNIGALPVCGGDGRLCGVVTDRDLVTRCMAAGKAPGNTAVRDVMTTHVIAARPDTDVCSAARIMAREQIRRLPVMENGKLCGMVSLADIACREEMSDDAAETLAWISSNLSSRD